MESDRTKPSFRAALSVEAVEARKYSCSLEVFIGDVKVWNSGHYSKYLVSDECILELTADGDLQLKGPNDEVGWRTGTSGQNVEVHNFSEILLFCCAFTKHYQGSNGRNIMITRMLKR